MQIACFGAANMDIKSKGHVPFILGTSNPVHTTFSSGGVARNIAENLSRLGIDISLVSRVGEDLTGIALINELKEREIDTSAISKSENYATATYTAIIQPNGEQLLALADMEIYDELLPEILIPHLPHLKQASYWLIDANLPEQTIQALCREAPHSTKLWAVPVSRFKAKRLLPVLSKLDGLVLNRSELHELTGQENPEQGCSFLHSLGIKTLVVTLGSKGAYLSSEDRSEYFGTPKVNVVDVTGAGDAFTAGILFGLFLNKPIQEAVQYGIAAASLTIQCLSSVSTIISPTDLQNEISKQLNEMAAIL